MVLCKECKFWKRCHTFNFGECLKINEKLEIIITVDGWDNAFVKRYETEEDFGCILGEKK
jgi:hypothetical protein